MKSDRANVLPLVLMLLSVLLGLSFMVPLRALSAQTNFTIWPDTTVPGIGDSGPDSAVELGVKFRADSDGSITGIRFYKAGTNTGTHIGNLWTNSGTLLATATFTNETVSGWQQVNFQTPVAITANTVYVASYHTIAGHYSDDYNYFAAKGLDNPPLHVPADGVSGVNGVYAYGSTSSFPNLGWKSSNYWVDVVFSATTSADTIPPTVTDLTVPATATTLTVPITSFTATDNVAVTGYLITESATTPSAATGGWSTAAPASYAFTSAGSKTLYAWAKDAVGNVSASRSATVTITLQSSGPEPAGWYAGDMHVHRSCGGSPQAISNIYQKMIPNTLTFVSLLADMGNGEVQDPVQDLPRVNGKDDPVSTPGQVVHWDAEWHWDPIYFQYPHQALGGHVVALGLTEAHQIWEEYTYPIFDWAHKQNGVAGFAHMQYLPDGIPQSLNCCIPLEYPVEVGLGAADFISLDVVNNNYTQPTMNSGNAINAYYRLLNCGFRPGIAAGTDHPCNDGTTVGSPLTYAQVAGGEMTYRNWVDGIAKGRTVVSLNGHNEFLNMTVNGSAMPGDEIKLTSGGSVQVTIQWTAMQNLTGTIELVQNGVVVATRQASVAAGVPASLSATVDFTKSGWLAARRMGNSQLQVHTAAVFVTVNNAPVRASAADAQFYVQWMDNLLTNTSSGGIWNSLFPTQLSAAQARYQAARALYQQIALEAAATPTITTSSLPAGIPNVSYTANLTASGGTQPYAWSLAGGSLPAGLSLDGTTGVISGIPTTEGTFTFTVQVADAGTSRQTATAALSISISAQTSLTIWPGTAVPTAADSGPDSAVELGVKFRSDASGSITGIRFYKASTNTGAHVVNLWTTSGTLLATAASTGETASGWQQVNFPTPVAIIANTVYVASYHTNAGHYSDDYNYFAAKGFDNPPLHVLADGVSGVNGVFAYGSTSSFPNLGWKGSNYWVDVVFNATSSADTTPPTVTAFAVPATSATLTVAITSFTATDNVAVTGYLVTESAGAPSASDPGWSATPPGSYNCTTAGTKTLYAWAKDGSGNISASKSDTVIITLSQSGSPILIITIASNPFSTYYKEILLAEGLNSFDLSDITSVTSSLLASYDVVILGEMPLTASQVTMFSNWVNAGGQLIAMRPDKKLAGLLGLTDLGATLSNSYLLVDTSTGPGTGIVGQTIQYHGTADRYSLSNASNLATLYANATTATSNPAVTLRSVGTNGGQAAAFVYDLARSVVYTRQGNPAWSGQERDSVVPIRSDDLYYGAASFDMESDWVDLNKVDIPQADEQQRLLVNLAIRMNLDKKSLPRFWYFPRSVPAVVVMTGDDHGNWAGAGGTAGRFDSYISTSAPGCSVDNWECIRSTSYVYPDVALSNAQASGYNNAGFEVGLHVFTNCADWTPASLESSYADQLRTWSAKYVSLPAPTTNRTHCIAWSDFATQPAVELAHGIRLDTNYYYWPATWINDKPGLFTGSGMPMRFTDPSGNLIDVYQATTQMTDESGQTYPFTIDTLLDRAVGPQGYYGAFVVNAHTDLVASSVSDAVIGSAIAHGIPVISAQQLLKWLDGRNGSAFNALAWNGTTLSFTVTAAQGANGLVAMVPAANGQTVTGVTNNGTAVPFTMVTVKGIPYARFSAVTGSYQVTYGSDSSPPTVTGVSPVAGTTGASTATDVSATFNKAMDPATITGGTIELRDQVGAVVPATVSYNVTTQTATLTPTASLANATTYTALIRGGATGVKDVSGNALASDYSWSFSTVALSSGPFSLWPGSTVPGVIDSGPDSAVELGVKFRAEVSGTVNGIRFYKANTNTGTHVGNLWDSAGKLLATASFTNETASGWQQTTFSTPVTINANTVYVASYHTGVGHYSFNSNFFNGQGMDSPPLHALANGVSGANGVFAYGSGSEFPAGGWNSTNYWVDVVFSASAPQGQALAPQTQQLSPQAQPPTLLSITVAPDNQRIGIGTTQQFTATGVFSDGSKLNLTSKVTWTASDINVVSIAPTGLVTAFSPGTVTITATLDGIAGSTNLAATEGIAGVSSDHQVMAKRK